MHEVVMDERASLRPVAIDLWIQPARDRAEHDEDDDSGHGDDERLQDAPADIPSSRVRLLRCGAPIVRRSRFVCTHASLP
jgi:hypothetical protein